LSVDAILHFFVGGSSISIESDVGLVFPVPDNNVSLISEGRLTVSDDKFCCRSLDIVVVVISVIEIDFKEKEK
jgi:hypothetical protein